MILYLDPQDNKISVAEAMFAARNHRQEVSSSSEDDPDHDYIKEQKQLIETLEVK